MQVKSPLGRPKVQGHILCSSEWENLLYCACICACMRYTICKTIDTDLIAATVMLQTTCGRKPSLLLVSDGLRDRLRTPTVRLYSCSDPCRKSIGRQLNATKCGSTAGAKQRCTNRRTALWSATCSIMGGFLVSTDAYAFPLAPLGRGSDTIGGPKLQQPSLKQVQVLPAKVKTALSFHAVHSYTLQVTGPTTSPGAM